MRPGCVPAVPGPATDTIQSYQELCVAQRKLFTLALHNQEGRALLPCKVNKRIEMGFHHPPDDLSPCHAIIILRLS